MRAMSDPAHSLLAWVALGLVCALCSARPAAAAETDWRDIEARIQYAWYTEDSRELTKTADQVTELSAAPLRDYYRTACSRTGGGPALRRLHQFR